MRKQLVSGALVGILVVGLSAAPSGASLTATPPEDTTSDEPTSEDVAPDEPEPDQDDGDVALDAGPWILTGEATGTVASTIEGISFDFFGRFPVTGLVDISGDGGANGDWHLDGDAILVVSGGPIAGTAEVDVTGDGLIGGDSKDLDLTGQLAISGSASVGSQTVAISESFAGTMQWRTLSEVCNRAWGEWIFSGDLNMMGGAFVIEAEGTWTGQRDTEGTAEDAASTYDAIWGDASGQPDSNLQLMRRSTELIRSYNNWVDSGPTWTVDAITALAEEAEQLIRSFDALSECQRTLFEPDVIEQYLNGLTHVVQNLLVGFNNLDGTQTDAFVHLTHLGARVGAFGAGARNPADAVLAEESMRRAAQYILDANADPVDGVPFIVEDTIRAVATAAAMGWSLNVGSGLEPATVIWARHFDTPPPDTSQGESEEGS